jgi:hypothetical protein
MRLEPICDMQLSYQALLTGEAIWRGRGSGYGQGDGRADDIVMWFEADDERYKWLNDNELVAGS